MERSEPTVGEIRAEELASIYLAARNTPDLDLLDAIYADDVVVHDCSAPEDIVGLEALKAFYRGSHAGFPDFSMRMDETLACGDRIVYRWTIEATHTGDLRGLPPTGRAVRFSGVAIDRVADERIVEEWVHFNLLDLLMQLGMEVAPAPDSG